MTDEHENLDDGGETLASHSTSLSEYLAFQDSVIGPEFRRSDSGEHPFPATENPEFSYIIDRAIEMLGDDEANTTAALLWVAVHAWRAGAIEAAVRCELAASTSGQDNIDL